MTAAVANPLEALLAKTSSLYSLPAVAMEVVQLTDQPQVDTRALKECIERDPALTVKVLRVVNSSLFGLSSKVENLTQAIALLGIKPLKLLVLGFSLPKELVEGLSDEALRNYWRGALTRAVAARSLAEQLWNVPGDDPFLVALLQDVGKLVLLQHVGPPYARFAEQVRREEQDLVQLERKSLGFDHRQLSRRLLEQWRLPPTYTSVIESPSDSEEEADAPPSTLTTIVRLANLLAELVDAHRLAVLPELLELGEKSCGLTKELLRDLVTQLEEQVSQLADILQVEVGPTNNFNDVLLQAHTQLAGVAEEAAAELVAGAEPPYGQLLNESQELARSVRSFVEGAPTSLDSPRDENPESDQPVTTAQRRARERFVEQLTAAVGSCRFHRRPLSLLLVSAVAPGFTPQKLAPRIKRLTLALCDEHALPLTSVHPLGSGLCGLLLPGYERHDAVSLAHELVARPVVWEECVVELKIGIGSVGAVAKGFEPARLVAAAEGCLGAAKASGGAVVKSIEVY